MDPFSVVKSLPFFSGFEGAAGSLNDSVARIEALKIRILGNATLLDGEKREIFQELDLLRGVFLETVSRHGAVPGVSAGAPVGTTARFGSHRLVLEGIVGHNKKITELLHVVSKIASTKLTVLFEGETGTGKELLARIVHLNSKREKFVTVNCGAFPPSLIESELFGHLKGAFTGAHADRKGKFEEADGGTIFLDEIGDLDSTAQVKLLRVLESGELQRVGSDKIHWIDVRVVAATNKPLESMVAKGQFREDLLYRINVCPLTVPPLRERRDEIEILLEHFIQEGRLFKEGAVPTLSPDLRRFILLAYPFPGNIRELKNMAQYIACIAEERPVEMGDLPSRYQQAFRGTQRRRSMGGLEAVRSEAERGYLVDLLTDAEGKIEKVCQETGLSKARVYQLLKKLDLNPADFRT